MTRTFVVAVAVMLASCSKGDTCERAYKKLLAMEKAAGKSGSSDDFVQREIEKCKADLKEHPDKAKMFECIADVSGTPTEADLDRCLKAAGAPSMSDMQAKRKGEAVVMLNKLGANAKVAFATNGAFPIGKVGPTPADECCKSGSPENKYKCPATTWTDPTWKALDFSIDGPTEYRYSYESDGKTFTATAVGDRDCDEALATYTLKGTVDAGNAPKLELTEPPKGTY